MKTEHIQIRVSLEEKRLFREAADLVGVSLSEWIRVWLLYAAKLTLGKKNSDDAIHNSKRP